MVTIERVAQRAGVSVATVSRTLNNSPAVKPATAQRVRQAIEALGYVPNQSARNLRRNESQVILALAPNFSNPYYSRILTGIGDRAWELEYSVLVCNTLGHANSERRFLKMMESHQADGAILLGCHWDYSWLARFAQRSHIVQCCEYVPDLACPSVSIDNYGAAREMTVYLQELGHRRIAMLGADNLAFMPCCENTIAEFGAYLWDSKAVEAGGDAPLKESDHGLDATRYMVKTLRLVRRANTKEYRSIWD